MTHAVAAARKVLPHRRDLALPRLGESLNNLANRFVEAKRLDEAVRAAGEAVEVRRELAAGLPDVFAPQLAVSLTTLAGCRSGAGDAVGAVDAAEEAVRTILPYFRREPIAFLTTMRACAQNWRVYCRKGHVKPDFVLSRRVDTVLSQFPE